jgi:hypothetical protein
MIGNEGQTIVWTDEAKAHYQVDIGAEGDGRYLRTFHGQEKRPGQGILATARWSGAQSRLILPTLKDTDYTLTVQVAIPASAIDDKAGIYQGDKRIAEFKADAQNLTVNFRSGSKDTTVLEIRCKGWIPKKVLPGNQDDRTLGIQLFGVTAKTKSADAKPFSANTGQWI